MENFENLYEVRKTVRFELVPVPNKDIFFKKVEFKNKKGIGENKKGNLGILVKNLESIYKEVYDNFIYYKSEIDKNGDFKELIFKNKIKIKYLWLRSNTKTDFCNFKKEFEVENEKLKKQGKKEKQLSKIYSLTEIEYLNKIFLDYLNNFRFIYTNLKNLLEKPLESQQRRKEFGFYIRSLKGKKFEFIKEFVNSIHNSNNPQLDEKLKDLKTLIQKTEELLLIAENDFLPSQSSGIQLAKASFNYYTVNKENKTYFDNEGNESKSKLTKIPLDSNIFRIEEYNKYKHQKELKFEIDKVFIKSIELSEDIFNKWSLDETYKKLKKFKSNAKNHFLDDIAKNEFRKFENNEFIKVKDVVDEKQIIERGELNFDNLNKFHPIFETTKENFDEFIELTNAMKDLNIQKNNLLQVDKKSQKDEEVMKLDKDIKAIAQQRGQFFNKPNESVQTEKYYKLCEFYKQIALKRGQSLTRIKGLEQEKIDSAKTGFWSLVMEENNKKSIVLIPKGSDDMTGKAKKFLDDEKNNVDGGKIIIYHFKSLTLRALKKLCFKEYNNTFFFEKDNYGREVLGKIPLELGIDFREYSKFKIQNAKNELGYEFYQKVLKTKAINTFLDIVNFGGLQEVLNKNNYKNIEKFEIELEKVCYTKSEILFDEEQKNKFIKNYNAVVFEIKSYDLRIQNENRKEVTDKHTNKNHTQKWLDFWDLEKNKNYDIKLNPEISIQYREANEELEKKKINNELDQPVLLKSYRNRFLKEQFTLNSTISLNSNSKTLNLAFSETKDIADKIDLFNKEFNNNFEEKHKKNDVWYYGIDRGLNELATLCITKFSNESYEINGKKINKPKFAQIEVYKLKDENGKGIIKSKYDDTEKEVEVIKNISYFIDDDNLFEPITTSCIDLTQAKIIKGKIVINGDKNTYLKLKELSAKRRIFELFSKSKINKNSEIKIEDQKGIFIIRNDNKGEEQIYWFNEEQKVNSQAKKEEKQNQEEKQNKLKKIAGEYLQILEEKNKLEDIETIIKINHLRDSITANMVGIISFLQEKYTGKICLENMEVKRCQKELIKDGNYTGVEEKMIDGHFNQSNQDISRRLEWSLYRKFQESGKVPPEIKQSIFLRDEFGEKQFGIIEFVRIGDTSKNCPYCENTYEKKNGKHYVCKDKIQCNFDSRESEKRKGFYDLDGSDKVGAYNVAKNGFKKLYHEKNEEILDKKQTYTKSYQNYKTKTETQITFKRSKIINIKK